MRIAAKNARRMGLFVLAAAGWLVASSSLASAQFFTGAPSAPRPPGEVPVPPDAGGLPSGPAGRGDRVAPANGPTLQSLPPTPANPTPSAALLGPTIPAGQSGLALTARFGREMPAITGGLTWRDYGGKPDQTGAFRLLKEDKGAAPVFALPPGGYVIHVGFGLASATRAVQLRAGETTREL